MNESVSTLIASANLRIEEFSRLVAGISYERKGILNSEMFFLWLCAQSVQPRRILESGRARGQSTLILARCFPESEIISVEHDSASPDVEVAAERLRGEANVKLLFGDATRLLVDVAQAGDVALIDGPKGFRGVRFALSLLSTRRLPLVFVHDAGPGTAERRFFEREMTSARYSDEPELVRYSHVLDDEDAAEIPLAHRYKALAGQTGYGYGLACLPQNAGYIRLKLAAAIAGAANRFAG
jgi:predicted O-methyltransferase YrrM